MADPVIAVGLYGETRGFLSFADYTPTRSGKAGLRMRMRAAKQEMDSKVAQVEAEWRFAELSIQGVSIDAARSEAKEARQRYESFIKPWLQRTSKRRATDDLDLVASWYIMYRPDVLRRLGVDFGKIEPVPQ